MLPISLSDAKIGVEEPAGGKRTDWMRPGLIGSLVLHVLAALLVVFGLPWLTPAPPEMARVMPVDLVRLGEKTAAPPQEEKSALPQEKAPEVAELEPADPVPVPQVPPPTPQAQRLKSKEGPKSDPLSAVTPLSKPDLPRSKPGPKSDPLPAVKPPKQPPPPLDDLDTRLKSLAKLQQQQAQARPSPRLQDDQGASNLTATSADAALGRQATYSVKDFIRAQIERHWNLDLRAVGAGDFVIAIHVVLNRDGSVGRADIVDDPRYRSSPVYRDLALSARNAVLVSSPLNLPPGRYDEVKDMTLNFNPRDVVQ